MATPTQPLDLLGVMMNRKYPPTDAPLDLLDIANMRDKKAAPQITRKPLTPLEKEGISLEDLINQHKEMNAGIHPSDVLESQLASSSFPSRTTQPIPTQLTPIPQN